MPEELRPPESWPGAGGLKSIAPDVPSWPVGPIQGLRLPETTVTAPPAKKGTGESWPGMNPSTSPTNASDTAASAKTQAPAPAAHSRERKASSHPAMGPSVILLLACVAIAAWVVLDPGSRMLQAGLLVVVLVAGGVFVLRTLRSGKRGTHDTQGRPAKDQASGNR